MGWGASGAQSHRPGAGAGDSGQRVAGGPQECRVIDRLLDQVIQGRG